MSYYEISAAKTVKTARNIAYVCEQCGESFSYKQPYEEVVHRKAEAAKNAADRQRVAKAVRDEVNQLAREKQQELLQTKPSFENYGYEQCPNCGYVQSWMLDAYKGSRSMKFVYYPMSFALILMAAVTFILNDDYFTETYAWWGSMSTSIRCLIGALAWGVVAALIAFFGSKLSARGDATRKIERTTTTNEPTITWDEIIVT